MLRLRRAKYQIATAAIIASRISHHQSPMPPPAGAGSAAGGAGAGAWAHAEEAVRTRKLRKAAGLLMDGSPAEGTSIVF